MNLQYKLNLTGITGGLSSGSVRGDDNVAGGMGDSKGTTSSSEGSMWHYGMARRAKGDARRTRVSFLLFWYIFYTTIYYNICIYSFSELVNHKKEELVSECRKLYTLADYGIRVS